MSRQNKRTIESKVFRVGARLLKVYNICTRMSVEHTQSQNRNHVGCWVLHMGSSDKQINGFRCFGIDFPWKIQGFDGFYLAGHLITSSVVFQSICPPLVNLALKQGGDILIRGFWDQNLEVDFDQFEVLFL